MPLVEQNLFTALPHTTLIQPKREHLGVLDLLRGIAALSVCLFHYTSGTNLLKLVSPFLAHTFSLGFLGVEIFFVISGFVIPYSIWGTGYRVSDFRTFITKRIVRICPPAYFSILLVVLQWYVVSKLLHHSTDRLAALNFTQVAENLLFIIPFTNQHWISGVFWTLAIEFQFYLLVGLLYTRIFATQSPWVFLCGATALSLVIYLPFLPKGHFFQYSTLFWIGTATMRYKKKALNGMQYLLALFILTSLCFLQQDFWASAVGLCTALCIIFVRANHAFFSWIGKISYSLYLTHMMVGAMAEYLLTRIWPPQSQWTVGIEIGICVGISILCAYCFYLLIELPFLKLARRLKL